MCNVCERKVDEVWEKLQPAQTFRTPDSLKGVNFSISHKDNDHLRIDPQNIEISKEAFINALHYLNENAHYIDNPIEIRSSNDQNKSGPLCLISRQLNNNIRCINYILPILVLYNLVAIDGNQPNRTWLL